MNSKMTLTAALVSSLFVTPVFAHGGFHYDEASRSNTTVFYLQGDLLGGNWIGTYKAGQPLYLKEGSFSLSKPLAIWC